ncbi:hypothetical protein SAMN05216480_12110 [Pustulibacterium marinum]|uniref:Uncharacterized protein n=1 Tax=Pustulibacterium marinum TaxID=1224947 RepID=A0A1I7ISJ8_9FLAO|nr:hypothetical protein [Pustulibacterium marinum]SFU75896.1 hypothetical protein SAMN05216480_12110 [Pustulibacterium marinum]
MKNSKTIKYLMIVLAISIFTVFTLHWSGVKLPVFFNDPTELVTGKIVQVALKPSALVRFGFVHDQEIKVLFTLRDSSYIGTYVFKSPNKTLAVGDSALLKVSKKTTEVVDVVQVSSGKKYPDWNTLVYAYSGKEMKEYISFKNEIFSLKSFKKDRYQNAEVLGVFEPHQDTLKVKCIQRIAPDGSVAYFLNEKSKEFKYLIRPDELIDVQNQKSYKRSQIHTTVSDSIVVRSVSGVN